MAVKDWLKLNIYNALHTRNACASKELKLNIYPTNTGAEKSAEICKLRRKTFKIKRSMLEKLYANKSEKDLKSLFNIYSGLLIVSIIIPIIMSVLGYIVNGKITLSYLLPFLVILLWSTFNVDYLKKKLKNKKD
jgi:hypothetical protein